MSHEGFYLEGQIFPPQINQAYVYASNDGSATLGFEITGKAGIQFDTSKAQLLSLNWPGVSCTILFPNDRADGVAL